MIDDHPHARPDEPRLILGPAPPPLTAGVLRILILTRLEVYQDLLATERTGTPDRSHAITLSFTKQTLVSEIEALLQFVTRLENKLIAERLNKWLVNPGLAVLGHFCCTQLLDPPHFRFWSLFHPRKLSQTPVTMIALSLLPWLGYPVALYHLGSLEHRLNRLAKLRKNLEMTIHGVQRGVSVEKFARSLESSHWDHDDWEECWDV